MLIPISLIALVLGYKVYLEGSREKEGLKLLGQAIGIMVMLFAFLSFLMGLYKCSSACYAAKKGSYAKKMCAVSMANKASCPLTGKVG